MKIVESPHQAYAHVDHWRREGLSMGLVPTMGALHEGHYSLVRRSTEECDITAASIFVNPTQFSPEEDLDRYPRTLEDDLAGLRELGCDLVFVPQPQQVFPKGFSTYVSPPAAAESLEGKFRPDHFRGVTTVVMKLFQILPVSIAFFGQKDFQQLAVIKKMVEDLNVPIRVVGCATVREEDGLALSSRNRYLSAGERERALCLSKALGQVHSLVSQGLSQVDQLEQEMHRILEPATDSIDYASIVDRETLEPLVEIDRPAVALIAAYVGKTRLIDNRLIGE
ncbi:MAG: pantoate--beta-alanine ligase [Planctomycetota bacterium]